jgi:hypothetical protein
MAAAARGGGGEGQERTRTRMLSLRGLRARKTSGSVSWIFYTKGSWQKTAKTATPRAIVRYASDVGLFYFPNRVLYFYIRSLLTLDILLHI